jgi:hypothetical protein
MQCDLSCFYWWLWPLIFSGYLVGISHFLGESLDMLHFVAVIRLVADSVDSGEVVMMDLFMTQWMV